MKTVLACSDQADEGLQRACSSLWCTEEQAGMASPEVPPGRIKQWRRVL